MNSVFQWLRAKSGPNFSFFRDSSSALMVLAFLSLSFVNHAEARRFTNTYVSFDLPEKWDCVLEQTEWVCRPSSPDLAQQAIIVLTAKETGPHDSLEAYQNHLKTPRVLIGRTGQPLQSEVKKIEIRNIATHPWVDGLHLSSEVPNYLTRYLATTKDKIALVVTFSAHQLHYSKFASDFFRAVESLRVVASSSLMKSGPGSGAQGGDNLGAPTGGEFFGGDLELPEEPGASDASAMMNERTRLLLGLAFLVGAVGIYLLIKRGRNKPRR